MERVILHADMNNCYASIETKLNPKLKGIPLAVCGKREDRHGIVLAKSQEAKVLGVKTGEAIWQAQLKCPNLLIVPPNYDEYSSLQNSTTCIFTTFLSIKTARPPPFWVYIW